MLVDDLLNECSPNNQENNFNEAVNRIKEAMKKGERYVYLPGKNNCDEFRWCATPETIDRLREEGFDINKVWDPCEYWSVEWYDK